jgi:hypothetical protein
LTIDESRAFMNMARHTTTSAHHRSRADRGAAVETGREAEAISPFHRLVDPSGKSGRRSRIAAILRRCNTPPMRRIPSRHTRHTPARPRPVAGVALVALVAAGMLAGCSSSSTSSTTTRATATATVATCHRGEPSTPVTATPVPGSASDWDITSFDGTVLRAHWFPLADYDTTSDGGSATTHPTILMGPGWSLPGDTDTSDSPGQSLLGADAISTLFHAGYNVLTWDPRGFGQSGGEAEVDSPAYEAKDVSTLIDWVATRPGVQLDAPGDPRMGMVGGSYGGGIQFVTAATDCRVDASCRRSPGTRSPPACSSPES